MPGAFKLQLMGVVRLLAPDGSEATPRSAKAQGLLAILATSRGRAWSRAALQDLLWSDRGASHGRDSLKKALAELRRCLNGQGAEVLSTGRGPVSLDMARLEVDVLSEAGAGRGVGLVRQDFLQGLDIRDPEFEAWLRDARAALAARAETPPCLETGPATRRRFHVVIRPLRVSDADVHTSFVAEGVVDRILIALRHCEAFKVHDHRQTGPDPGREAGDFALACAAHPAGDGQIRLSVTCIRCWNGEMIWGGQFRLGALAASDDPCAATVAEIVDRVSDSVYRASGDVGAEARIAARHAMEGIERIFALRPAELETAAVSLRRAIDLDPRGSYFAWYAFLCTFRLEATKGKDLPELREHAEALARRALEIDPHNPVTRSTLAHVYSFLFRDFDAADAVLAPLSRTPPDLPMYHQSRALLGFYTGRIDQAETHARRALRLGLSAPHAYVFATTNQMVALARGNVDTSLRFGREAMGLATARAGVYEPTLRYLAAAHAYRGDTHAVREAIARIRAQSPDFTVESMNERAFPIPSDDARQLIMGGLLPIARELT